MATPTSPTIETASPASASNHKVLEFFASPAELVDSLVGVAAEAADTDDRMEMDVEIEIEKGIQIDIEMNMEVEMGMEEKMEDMDEDEDMGEDEDEYEDIEADSNMGEY
ncbi:hypothetical protein BZA05DRAFT_449458 [Tricharina praecox]|uniref:uncharacterized protein n=1 Tax=Tricharina praecox TaxID=43433 RepID=UPI00222014C6|nr:uncharacterized protein BZA05DRAFT_449458 [Tricharina praecox]KAI5841642.1 hypothetical protein BZA05DRAFT_449458 [Tricharina praecox]